MPGSRRSSARSPPERPAVTSRSERAGPEQPGQLGAPGVPQRDQLDRAVLTEAAPDQLVEQADDAAGRDARRRRQPLLRLGLAVLEPARHGEVPRVRVGLGERGLEEAFLDRVRTAWAPPTPPA
jgi:hypothetical protein